MVVYTSNPSTLGLRQEDHELGHKARPIMKQRNNPVTMATR